MPDIEIDEKVGVYLDAKEVDFVREATAEVMAGLIGADRHEVYVRSSIKLDRGDPRDVLPADADAVVRVKSPSLWKMNLSPGELGEVGNKIKAAIKSCYDGFEASVKHFEVFVEPSLEGGTLE